MSDTSSLSDSIPSDAVIESQLREVVQTIYKAGNLEELTVKRVRGTAETNLGLADGFLKGEAWSDRSKTIIKDEAVSVSITNYSIIESTYGDSRLFPFHAIADIFIC